MQNAMPSLNNISWERLDKENSVTYPWDSPTSNGKEVVFAEGFPIEGGKGKFVPAKILQPDELPDEEFSMILTEP